MKNVAATSGHRVSFAALLFAVEITWEGSWAGSDNVLNFYRRPPRATLALVGRGASSQSAEYKFHHAMQEKNAPDRRFFAAAVSVLSASWYPATFWAPESILSALC
jgi:hypothetical protein